MNYLNELIERKIESATNAVCPYRICGEDDAWYEAREDRLSDLNKMLKLVNCELHEVSELEYRECEILVKKEVDNELHRIAEEVRVGLHDCAVDRDNFRFSRGIING